MILFDAAGRFLLCIAVGYFAARVVLWAESAIENGRAAERELHAMLGKDDE
jgi:hypothetical protein